MNQEQLIEELKKLGMLHDSGVLSDEEFQEMKQKLLKRFEISTPNELTEVDKVRKNEPSDKKFIDTNRTVPNKFGDSDFSIQSKKSINPRKVIKRPEISKRTLGIICGVGILLIGVILFFVLHKSDYQKALDSIEEQQGKILSDVEDNEGHLLIYATEKGLYLWNLQNKEPKKLYASIDSLVQYSYWYDSETHKIKQSALPLDSANYDEDKNQIFSISPKKLYRVIGPWILIGKHYVANIKAPNKLYQTSYAKTSQEFNGLPYIYNDEEGGDWVPDSIGFDNEGNMVITVYNNLNNLPGINEYNPQYLDKETWDNGYYIDKNLLSTYGNLFPEYQHAYYIGIPIDRPYVTGRKIIIGKNNQIRLSPVVSWGDFTFDEKDMTPSGMIPIYQKIEKNFKARLEENLEAKKKELEEYRKNYVERLRNEAIPVYELVNLYERNIGKAAIQYPLHHTYIFEARLEGIEYINNYFAYCVVNYLNHTYFYTNDTKFSQLDYPCKVLLKAEFYQYGLKEDVLATCYAFINTELLNVEYIE